MNQFDDTIKAALREDNDDLLKDFDEPGLFSQAMTTLRRGPRFAKILAFTFSFVFFALQIWTAIRFFQATEVQHMIAWATGFLTCGMAVGMLKMWFWMQMDKYVVLREVKRLELQVARLSSRIK
jgi:Family of unknown function (DUF6768)